MAFGNGFRISKKSEDMIIEDYNTHLLPEYYNSYNVDEIPNYMLNHSSVRSTNSNNFERKEMNDPEETIQSLGGPMDSPWPMYGHDVRHTSRSPYSTANNPYFEKWRFTLSQFSYHCAPVIDNDGVIYVGRGDLFAVYPNGTLKWEYEIIGVIEAAPAIDEYGVLYVGSTWGSPSYLYAIYSGNGTLKWKYHVGNHVDGSPVINSDGTIYFSDWSGNIHAVYPNGTRKWIYHTGDVVTSAPAIGLDGTIYVGSHDNYVYAFYPNNGTVKWKFNTGNWVHGSPSIGDDGTVYIGSDNNLLYAFYPNNGTVKWTHSIGAIGGSPAIGDDGTLYVGTFQQKFYAIYPNGTVKWKYDAPGRIWFGTSAALSADGSIYFGTTTMDGGSGAFIVLNPDGTERFRDSSGFFETSPAIGQDGTVYACSSHKIQGDNFGYLHAFGEQDPNAPSAPDIDGPTSGKVGIEYEFTFKSTSPIGNDLYYWIEWGDYGTWPEWLGPYSSGEEITMSHTWLDEGTYNIKARAIDTENLWGPWGTLEVTMPRNRAINRPFFNFLERLPNMFPLLRQMLGGIL